MVTPEQDVEHKHYGNHHLISINWYIIIIWVTDRSYLGEQNQLGYCTFTKVQYHCVLYVSAILLLPHRLESQWEFV